MDGAMSAPRAYLDHAATAPVHPEVVEALTSVMTDVGNPSSLHAAGRCARKRVEEARESIAAALGARPSEVVLTGGGTEADNLAVKGIFWARRAADPRRTRILASAVEHHAIVDPLEWLQQAQGAMVEWIPVDGSGRLDVHALRDAIEREPASVALITVMAANNEVGTIQPIGDVVAAAEPHGIPVHSDAVQAIGALSMDFGHSGLDAMTVSAHKVGGPAGVGTLLVRRDLDVVPVLHGGGQERDIRSGTIDVAGAAGFAAALDVTRASQDDVAARLRALRTRLVDGLVDRLPNVILNGPCDPAQVVPGIAHFSFPGCEGDALLLLLDAVGIEVSTGSACTAGVPQASHVLLAMGIDPEIARGSLRFSLGWNSTAADIDAVIDAMPAVLQRARAAGMINGARSAV